MEDFSEFNLSAGLQNSLERLGYAKPTDIQKQAIPSILAGKDVLGTAQTGTGKTGAFLIPLITFLEKTPTEKAIILAPTRELAQQIFKVALDMIKHDRNLRLALLIGGDSMTKQLFHLKQKPRIIIGTPGRVNDHLNRGTLDLSHTSFAVLDETDRMLDMGFGVQIDDIFKHMPEKRQTALFSATLPKQILRLVNNYLIEPVRVTSGELNSVAKNIQQKVMKVQNKQTALEELLPTLEGTIIIFVKTQRSAERIMLQLRHSKYKVDVLHGGLRQGRRTSVIKNYRDKRFNILVATDIAARGLDIPHIAYVLNYDLPDNPEDFIHRLGRTARAERNGIAISFVGSDDGQKWKNIERFLEGKEVQSSNYKPRRNHTRKPSSYNPKGSYGKHGNYSGGNFRDSMNEGRGHHKPLSSHHNYSPHKPYGNKGTERFKYSSNNSGLRKDKEDFNY